MVQAPADTLDHAGGQELAAGLRGEGVGGRKKVSTVWSAFGVFSYDGDDCDDNDNAADGDSGSGGGVE